jgi:NAD(P) transhydrogenase
LATSERESQLPSTNDREADRRPPRTAGPADVPWGDPDVVDSEGILGIDRVPEHLLVVGGGAVGAEYASIFADLGSQATVV